MVHNQSGQASDPTGYVNGDVSYHLYVLGRMIEQLPPELAKSFRDQLKNLSEALLRFLAEVMQRDAIIKEMVEQQRLNTAYITFDLEATKRERDALLGGSEDNDGST